MVYFSWENRFTQAVYARAVTSCSSSVCRCGSLDLEAHWRSSCISPVLQSQVACMEYAVTQIQSERRSVIYQVWVDLKQRRDLAHWRCHGHPFGLSCLSAAVPQLWGFADSFPLICSQGACPSPLLKRFKMQDVGALLLRLCGVWSLPQKMRPGGPCCCMSDPVSSQAL